MADDTDCAAEDYTDKELYEYTVTIMKNITHYYLTTDFDEDTDINKLIERNVARKVANVLPDRYVEAEVTVLDIGTKRGVVTSFSTDDGVKLIAMYDEVPGAMISHGEMTKKIIERPVSLGLSDRGCGEDKEERVAAFRERLKKIDKKNAETKNYPQDGENGHYDPLGMTEDFFFSNHGSGRGSKVETLPGGQGLGELSDLEYFQDRLWNGLNFPPKFKDIFMQAPEKSHQGRIYPYPTSWATMTEKTPVGSEKPTIDFTKISQISAPAVGDGLPRYESGVHVGIDLAKVNVKEESMNRMAEEMAVAIDKQILEDITKAVGSTYEKPFDWAVPTFGWTEEKTNWDKASGLTYIPDNGVSDNFFTGASTLNNPFGCVLTTDNAAPYCGDTSPVVMEEISFTEEELDELIDLLIDVQSEVMKFA